MVKTERFLLDVSDPVALLALADRYEETGRIGHALRLVGQATLPFDGSPIRPMKRLTLSEFITQETGEYGSTVKGIRESAAQDVYHGCATCFWRRDPRDDAYFARRAAKYGGPRDTRTFATVADSYVDAGPVVNPGRWLFYKGKSYLELNPGARWPCIRGRVLSFLLPRFPGCVLRLASLDGPAYSVKGAFTLGAFTLHDARGLAALIMPTKAC
jgi:hypothetical protein